MARPKKTEDGIDARQRICDALWDLLEVYELREITISMITSKAGCNRGTFYYYFKDLDDLLGEALSNDLMKKSFVAELIFRISTGDETAVREVFDGDVVRRLSIVVNHAGIELAFGKVFELLVNIWSSILCPDGGKIKPEAQAIVLYYVGGLLGMVAAMEPEYLKDSEASESITQFILENARFVTKEIYKAQGLPQEVAEERLAAVVQFLNSVS